jgi:KipI family sensor histidine kinase inhibitor
MTQHPPLTIRPLAESALLVLLGDRIEPETNLRALALAAAIGEAALSGVVDVVPSYVTVLVSFDPGKTDGGAVAASIEALAGGLGEAPDLPSRERFIPVHYGAEFGPDLADVAAHTGLSPDEVIARHAAATYRVACMGFSPGFAYLIGLPPELVTPRRSSPRTRVPRGSVAIGGAQTGVYALDTPGGWSIIGHTGVPMFAPEREEPFFLNPGDRVHFVPTPHDQPAVEDAPSPLAAITGTDPELAAARSLHIVSPGALATVQDLGRPGLMHLGVTPGGALDRRALILGNRLLANDPGAAALECAMAGPVIRFDGAALIAVTGADLAPRLNGGEIPMWEPVIVREGDTLDFARPVHPGGGLRTYLCIDGGIAIPPVMGSRSTDLFGRIGGLGGRPLAPGDILPLGEPAADPDAVLRRRLTALPPRPNDGSPVRAVPGPQDDRFTAGGLAAFFDEPYAVTPRSDRMGLRLAGPPVTHSAGADTISEGIAAGAVQVPGDGQPIVLLPARQTVGGYPKIATVIGADLDRLGQLAAGDAIRFQQVDPATAREATLAARAALGPDAVRETSRAFILRPGLRAKTSGWDAAAAERVATAARAAGVTEVVVSAPGLSARISVSPPLSSLLAAARFGGSEER